MKFNRSIATLIAFVAIVLTACSGPLPLSGQQPPAGTAPTTAPAATQQPPDGRRPSPVQGSSWTPEQKCEWLSQNFPQTTEQVQDLGARLAQVAKTRIRTHRFECTSVTGVMDGFIVLGPNEGFSGEVTLTVPKNGALDAYDPTCGAKYSHQPKLLVTAPAKCDATWRAFEGTVQALSITYWPWLDESPPISGQSGSANAQPPAAAAAAPASVPCIQPMKLASDNGWADKGWADQKYGGLRVELTTAGSLPAKWEAQASGRRIGQDDQTREMVPGFWTIYPPHACRVELGYSS